jgi:gliding motility-associated-like protein
MKRLLLLFLLFAAIRSMGQISVEVVPADTVACYHDSIVFEAIVTGADAPFYKWLKNGVEIPFQEDSLLIFPGVTGSDTAIYQCVITFAGDIDTSNFSHLGVHEEIVFDTLYRYNELGCPGICKGQFKTLISGGLPPYTYNWGGGFSQDTLVFGLCPGYHTLTITDMRGCKEDSVYLVDVLRLPKVGFEVLPNDTVYLTNPLITMQFPDTAKPYMVNWEWSIEKAPDTTVIFSIANISPASYTFDSTGTFQVYLNFTDQNGCDSTVIRDVVVKTAELKIAYVITPNGDDKNDLFEIRVVGEADEFDYRIVYMGTELLIWDRWGKKVYSQKDYESGAWDGGNLPDGVYFFLLTCKGQWDDEFFRGTVTILGRSN